MKNRILVTLAGFGLAWVMACVPAKAADYENGSGTPDDPYEIGTAEQLDGVRDDLSASYVLTADISLEDYQNWEPLVSL